MSDDGSGEWTCSKCGSTLSFIGPITKRRVIEDHEYWIHEVPERDRLRAEGRQAEWRRLHNNGPLFDEAFYDGARITAEDCSFLRVMKVGWAATA